VAGCCTSRHEEQRRALSAKSIGNLHQILLKAFGDAVDSEVLARNPASRAKPPKNLRGPEKEMVVWSEDQLRSFLSGIEDKRWYPHLRLAAMTGMRRGEILGLRWGDIDLDNKRLTVRQTAVSTAYRVHFDTPKSHKPRTVDLDDLTCKVLRRHRAQQAAQRLFEGADYFPSDLVFTEPTGALTHPDTLSQAMNRLVAARQDLPRLTLHGLRHTHATLLFKSGASLKVVAERLGHADPDFTLRQYVHVLPSMQADAVAKMTAMVDG
jgi:integrase